MVNTTGFAIGVVVTLLLMHTFPQLKPKCTGVLSIGNQNEPYISIYRQR